MNSNALISFFFGRDVAMWTGTLHEKSHEPFCFVLKTTVFKHVNTPILCKEIAWNIDNEFTVEK